MALVAWVQTVRLSHAGSVPRPITPVRTLCACRATSASHHLAKNSLLGARSVSVRLPLFLAPNCRRMVKRLPRSVTLNGTPRVWYRRATLVICMQDAACRDAGARQQVSRHTGASAGGAARPS